MGWVPLDALKRIFAGDEQILVNPINPRTAAGGTTWS
jgi:hypothetical protein